MSYGKRSVLRGGKHRGVSSEERSMGWFREGRSVLRGGKYGGVLKRQKSHEGWEAWVGPE